MRANHPSTVFSRLPDRGVIAVEGPDSRSFLQGIVTNDLNRITEDQAGYGAFLTPQGKYLFDFFMVMQGEALLIETERTRIPDFIKRLSLYKLRARVELSDQSAERAVFAVFGNRAADALGRHLAPARVWPVEHGTAFRDPRLKAAGIRLVGEAAAIETLLNGSGLRAVPATDYDIHRLALGLPDGSRDLIVNKSALMENGFDELGGIDWQKGCYMGQEVTARMKHRGLAKKRLLPVRVAGGVPEAGTPVIAGERRVGEVRSSRGEIGLALLRLDAVGEDHALTAGGRSLRVHRPDWVDV